MKKNDNFLVVISHRSSVCPLMVLMSISMIICLAISSGCSSKRKTSIYDGAALSNTKTSVPMKQDTSTKTSVVTPVSKTTQASSQLSTKVASKTPVTTESTSPTEVPSTTDTNPPDKEIIVDNPVALKGSVTDFPKDSTTDIKAAPSSFAEAADAEQALNGDALQGPDVSEDGITSANMVPTEALVSLFLLDDVDYENPIATVMTDVKGAYEIRADDVREYLDTETLVDNDAMDVDVITAFKALGQIQVRALILQEDESGESTVVAIQSIADPNDVDEVTGEPLPVVIDPIIHRAVKAVIEQIREAIGSLRRLGLAEESVRTLAKNVIKDVVPEIRRVIRESAKGKIEIPVGKSPREVIRQQIAECEVPMDTEAKKRLKIALKSKVADKKAAIVALTKEKMYSIKNTKKSGKLMASMGSAAQGMLSGLKTRLNDSISEKVDKSLEGVSDEVAAKFFGVTAENSEAIRAAKDVRIREKRIQEDTTLRQFFLSMGLSVVMETNVAGDAGVIAIHMPLPYYMEDVNALGGQGQERNVRLFTLGDGELDEGSLYTTEQPDSKLRHAPRLSSLVEDLFAGQSAEQFQETVDASYERIHFSPKEATPADFVLLERIELYHMLNDILESSMLISQPVLDAIRKHQKGKIKLKMLASVIAKHFHWVRESVTLTPEGFPIFNERLAKLPGKYHRVSPAEIVKVLSLRLGKTAKETVAILTEQKGFYAQFASEAIQSSIQQSNHLSGDSELFKTLANAYPKSPEQFKELIIGSKRNAASAPYMLAKSRLMRGIISAIPAELFGRKLTGETTINMRSALFLLDYVVQRHYPIHEKEGFFKAFDLKDKISNKKLKRTVPHFKNIKYMEPNVEASVASIVAALLNMTLIDDGDFFELARKDMAHGLAGLPSLPEFDVLDVDEYDEGLAEQLETVVASCVVERFDPSATVIGDKAMSVRIFNATYDHATGDYRKEKELEGAGLTTWLVPGTDKKKVKYIFANIPSIKMDTPVQDKVYGRGYVMKFEMPNYTSTLPELFFWVDGYTPKISLCDEVSPLFIGPDIEFEPLPSIALSSDQKALLDDGETRLDVGFDLSNIEKAKAPLYLTKDDQEKGAGKIDARFISTNSGYALIAFDKESVGFAPLFGYFNDGQMQLSVKEDKGFKPLYGIHSLIGTNTKSLLKSVIDNDSGLQSMITMSSDLSEFGYERLYLMRDRDENFWIVEASALEIEKGSEKITEAIFEFVFAKVNPQAQIVSPELIFSDNEGFPSLEGGQDIFESELFYQSMHYGDWLVLDPPSGYEGKELLPAESFSFMDRSADYDILRTATDGVVFRFAGHHFDEKMPETIDTRIVFDSPPVKQDIPMRLEAGRKGITFAKLRFDKRSSKYVLMQKMNHRPNFVAKLIHGDIVVVFGNDEDKGTPQFLGRVVKQSSGMGSAMLGIEWVDYEALLDMPIPADIADTRHVICVDEENMICQSDDLPALHLNSFKSAPVGVVFDQDFDGVPALFDVNDKDPNIPNNRVLREKGLLSSHLRFFSGSDGNVKTDILLKTMNIYPGDIKSVDIQSPIFGEESVMQTVFTCMPPRHDIQDAVADFSCMAKEVSGGVTVRQVKHQEEGVVFSLSVPENVFAAFEEYIPIRYRVTFNTPKGVEGNTLICGEKDCLGLPTRKGYLEVLLSNTDSMSALGTLTDFWVTLPDSDPVSVLSLDQLDMAKPVTVSASIVEGAKGYALMVFCPAQTLYWMSWQPDEKVMFKARSHDVDGTAIQPTFDVDMSWLESKRSCSMTMSAYFENDSGEFLGETSVSKEGIIFEGAGTDELDDMSTVLKAGDKLCLMTEGDTAKLTVGECEGLSHLLTLNSIAGKKTALVSSGEGILSIMAEDESQKVDISDDWNLISDHELMVHHKDAMVMLAAEVISVDKKEISVLWLVMEKGVD